MSRTTYTSVGPTRSKLEWEEWSCPFCNTRAVDDGIKAPKGWYRCPACGTAMPQHQMFYRTRGILVGPSNAFPTLELVGSVVSDATTPAVISAGDITAQPGDQLIAQALGKTTGLVDTALSVTWGSAAVAMLPDADTYLFDSSTAYGRCMRHTVLAPQTAAMTFNFSGTVPEHRVVVVMRLRGVVAPTAEPYSDQDDRQGYPDAITSIFAQNDDYLVLCHAQSADVSTTPVTWDNSVTQRIRLGSTSLVNSVLSNTVAQSVNRTIRMTSGPNVPHGTGFFAFTIQQ